MRLTAAREEFATCGLMSKQHWAVGTSILLLTSSFVFAQATGQPSPTPTPPSGLAEIDTLIKIVAALITGIATLIGLPIVFLTYRKTRAEITKLELEAKALRQKEDSQPALEHDDEGNIRIVVDHSPYSNIHVLADPRFLAPLLILLDFIFAWIVLTMAGHLLSIFGFSVLRTFVLTVLSGLLLIPIARQVLRVRVVLRPPNTEAEVRASQRQVRVVAYAVYASAVASSLVFGALMLLLGQDNLMQLGRYLAWALIVLGLILIIAFPLIMRKLNLYLTRLHEQDSQLKDKSEA